MLDTSMAVSWFFEDEASKGEDLQVLRRLGESWAVVPAIWPFEVANVLLVALRRERLKSSEVYRVMELLSRFPIKIEDVNLDLAFKAIYPISQELGLSIYDASYLELAMRRGLPLATKDTALANSAQKAGVPLVIAL